MIGKAAVLIDGGYIRALNRDYFGLKRIDFPKFLGGAMQTRLHKIPHLLLHMPTIPKRPTIKKGTRTKIKHGQVSTRIKEVP